MQHFFGAPLKIAHFGHISLSPNQLIKSIVPLIIHESDTVPEGFGFKQVCKATLAFPIVPEEHQTEFYAYQTSAIKDWPQLKELFNTLKSNGFTVCYTFDNKHVAVNHFDRFKQAVISDDAESKQRAAEQLQRYKLST